MTVWYVRPDTSHSGTRNGTSYATAWGGWSAVVWGVGGVTAGDILYVCGAHAYASTITVGAHLGSSGNPCTISGGYSSDLGSITFTGASFINLGRSYTTIDNLRVTGGTSNCIFTSGTLTGLTFSSNTFTAGTQSIVSFSGGTGTSYTDVIFSSNTFTGDCRNGGNATGAISWFVANTGAISTFTRLTIQDNTFSNLTAGRAAIHCRAESDVDVTSILTDAVVIRNTFSNVLGYCIEIADEHSSFGIWAGLNVSFNVFTNCSTSPVSTSLGGCVTVKGFIKSNGLGAPIIEYNSADTIVGPAGFANLFYGTYIVRYNNVNNFSTLTIDGNGVLFDFGCQDSKAYANLFRNLNGKSGVSNSGVAIMVLDSTGVKAYSNVAINCYVGIHFGNAGSGQSANVYNNTIANCGLYGIDILATADEANCVAKNNLFTALSTVSVPSVRNQGGAWAGEDYNRFVGFTAASGHTLGPNTTSGDAIITDGYKPELTSPLLTGGTNLGYVRDFEQKQCKNYIGAYGYSKIL